MSAPAGAFGCSGRGRSSLMRRGEVTPPYGSITGGAQQRADVPKAWLLPTKFRSEIWGVSHGHRPLRGEGKAQSTALASGAQRSVCGADASDGRRGRQRSPPKVFSNLGQSLSRGKTATAPFAQGSLGLRGTGRTSPGHRSSQQPQAGRDRARPLREHRECRSVGRCT